MEWVAGAGGAVRPQRVRQGRLAAKAARRWLVEAVRGLLAHDPVLPEGNLGKHGERGCDTLFLALFGGLHLDLGLCYAWSGIYVKFTKTFCDTVQSV